MKKEKSEEYIHSNVPKRLISDWRKVGRSDRKLADLRGVNHFYISELLWRGIEPSNPEIRAKLSLPRKPIKPRGPDTRPEWLKIVQKGIRFMRTETTRDILRRWKNDE